MKADLHLHSNHSDGSNKTNELVELIKQAGLEAFALTDHDTIDGVIEIEKYVPDNIRFIKGIELTCLAGTVKCHILGYNCNPHDKTLNELISKGKVLRRKKLEARIEYLKDKWGIVLTKEELDWLYTRTSPVKTHFANILVNRKLSDDNVSAMKKYLDGCHTPNTRFDGQEAINAIKASGGIPIWAHPLGGEGEVHLKAEEFIPKLKIMQSFGIQGLECYYSRYSMEEIEYLIGVAKENNLLITGGSDFHGSNKKNINIAKLNTENIPIDLKIPF